MNVITAFGIGAVIFVFIVLLTAFYLRSASVLISATNKDHVIDIQDGEKGADDELDDMKVHGAPGAVSEKS